MNIVIEVIAVTVTNATNAKGGTYRKLEVAYKDEKGEFKGKKLTDFSVKEGVNLLVGATPGTKLTVATVKNGEFRNWEKIYVYGAAANAGHEVAPAPHTYSAPTPTPVANKVGSNYETKEERAARQVMIVRQSSIASAINAIKTDKVKPSVEEILKVAKAFEDYVMGVEPPKQGFDDFMDDVPE